MKKTILLGLMLLFAVTLVFAAKEADTARQEAMQQAKAEGNMTFGQCVSSAAEAKNVCYDNVKTQKDACISSKNESDKAGLKQCSADYKKNKDECKKTFKSEKKECAKIKHSFIDSMKVMFK
jgi:predicted solute-binding protein